MASGSSAVTAEHLADLKSDREAQLVKKFVSGVPLLELEMSELAHLIPAAALADPPPLQVAYLREIPEYAAEIGVNKRTVYRWRDEGIEARDACPLDQPGQMLAWWARRKSSSAPDYLTKWAAKNSTPGTGAAASAPDVKPAPTAKTPEPPGTDPKDTNPGRESITLGALAGMGIDASVQLLRQTVEANAKLVASALANPDDSALAHYQNRFEKSIEQLRKAEDALFKFQKMRGDLAPRSEFRADLVTIMTGLRGMMRRRANNVAAAVRLALHELKLTPEVVAQVLGSVHAAVDAEGRREEAQLRTAKNWKTLPSGEVVTDATPAAAPVAPPPTTPAPAPEPAAAPA